MNRHSQHSFALHTPHSALMLSLRLIFVSVVWGVNFAVVKSAIADFSPMTFNVVRFAVSALFLVAVMAVTRESLRIERGDLAPVVVLGLIGITLYNTLFVYGLKYTTAANSALFISTSPLFAGLFQKRLAREQLRMEAAAGLLLAFLGVVLIMGGRPQGLSFMRHGMIGDVLTICAASLWALYSIKAKPLLEKYAPIKVTAYSMAAGTLMLVPLSIVEFLHQPWGAIRVQSWMGLAYSSLLSGGLGFTLWYQGIKQQGIARTVVYHYLVPLVAVVFAALFLGERITASQIAGGASVLGGVYLVQRRPG